MFGDIMQPTHLLFVLLVALLVLGPKRLPEVGKTLGSGLRDFRDALSGNSSEDGSHHGWLGGGDESADEQRHQPSTQPEPEPQPDLSYTAQADPVYPDHAVDDGFPSSTPTVDFDEPVEDAPAVATVASDTAVHQPAVTPVAHWEPEATPPPRLSVAPTADPAAPAGDHSEPHV